MAINYFVGWEQQDLEVELRAAQEELAAGKATIRTASADVGVWSQVENSLTSRIEMLLQGLNRLDPVNYPIDQVSRTAAFRCVISGGPEACRDGS